MTIKTVQTLSTIWVVSIAINIYVLFNMMEEIPGAYPNASTSEIEICYYNK